MKRYILVFIFLSTSFLFAQEDYNPSKKIPKSALIKDFDLMTNTVLDFHPNPFAFVSVDSLTSLSTKIKKYSKGFYD